MLLRATTLKKFVDDPTSKLVEELKLPIAGARIDMAVINGSLHGYEIKSAVDTLQRLPGQIDAYTKVFDYLTIVTEEKHCHKVSSLVPDWIGILACQEKAGRIKLEWLQKGSANMKLEGFYIAKLLWRQEILDILQILKIPHRKKDRNWLLCELLVSHIELTDLRELVRDRLKSRPADWKMAKADCEGK